MRVRFIFSKILLRKIASLVWEMDKETKSTMKKAICIGVLSSLTTGIAAAVGGTLTLYADFCRRFLEMLATVVSFCVYRWMGKNREMPIEQQGKIKKRTCAITGMAMVLSSVLLALVSILGFSTELHEGNVIPGFIIAVLGVLLNFYFFMSYKKSLRVQYDAIIHSQYVMYRAKTGVDTCVVFTLGCILFVPKWSLLPWIDLGCTLIVAGCLFVEGMKNILRKEEV